MDSDISSLAESIDAQPAPARLLLLFAFSSTLIIAGQLVSGLIFVGLKYVLKDELHLTAERISLLTMVFDIPWYVAFLFGILRDRWRPFGRGDRAYLLACSLAVVVCCVLAAIVKPGVFSITVLIVAVTAAASMFGASVSGILAAIGKRRGLPGRLAVAMTVLPMGVALVQGSATGLIMEHFGWSTLCLVSAGIAALVVAVAFWQPAALVRDIEEGREDASAAFEPLRVAIARFLGHREALIAALICTLWNFTAGWGTPLFFHFTNTLKFTDSQFEFTSSITLLGNILAALSYAALCFRISLRLMLYLGIGIGILGCAGYALVHDYRTALAVGFFVGATCGLGNSAIQDLLIRSTPRRLEALAATLAGAGMWISNDVSDLIGSMLYTRGGFLLALGVTLLVNAIILPLLPFIPARVFKSEEGTAVNDGGLTIDAGKPGWVPGLAS
jgi:MFS family permease